MKNGADRRKIRIRKEYEKEYLHYYRSYVKNKIDTPVFENMTSECKYLDDEKVYNQLGAYGMWYRYIDGVWNQDGYLNGRNRRKLNVLAGYSKRHMGWKILAFVLVAVLIVNMIQPNTSGNALEWIGDTYERITAYRSAAVDEVILTGIQVKAPRGALAEGQTIQALEYDLDEAMIRLAEGGTPVNPLIAFEFDGGMGDYGSFNKEVTLHIDLEEYQVPQGIYEELVAYRIDSKGVVEMLDSEVDKDMLKVYTMKNSQIVIGVLFFGILIARGSLLNDKYGEAYQDYASFQMPGDEFKGYMVHIPNQMIDGFSPEMLDYSNKSKNLVDKYGLKWNENLNMYVISEMESVSAQGLRVISPEIFDKNRKATTQFYSDQEYTTLKKFYKGLDFPPAAKAVFAAIEPANNYLFKKRGLKRIGHTVDIIVKGSWPKDKKDMEALEVENGLYDSYVQINPNSIYSIINKVNEKAVADELIVSMTHELLHVIQHEYYGKDRMRAWDGDYSITAIPGNMWNTVAGLDPTRYSEALALVLEKEAGEYFEQAGIIDKYNPTTMEYRDLQMSWTEKLDVPEEILHGYAFSRVLEYQRDHDKENTDYVEDLLNIRSEKNSIDSIYDKQPENEPDLMYEFMDSVEGRTAAEKQMFHAENILFKKADQLITLEITDHPVSLTPYQLVFSKRNPAYDAGKSVLVMFANEKSSRFFEAFNKHFLYVTDDVSTLSNNSLIPWKEPKTLDGFQAVEVNQMIEKAARYSMYIYLTDDYYDRIQSKDNELNFFLAISPEKPMAFYYEEETMSFVVEVDKAPSDINGFNKGRILEIEVPGTSIPPYRVIAKPGEKEVRVHLLELLLNEEDHSGSATTVAASKLVTGIMETNMRTSASILAISGGDLITTSWNNKNDSLYIGIDETFSMTDSEGNMVNISDAIKKKGIPIGVTMSVSENPYTNQEIAAKVEAENGAYIEYYAQLDELFRYFRYSMTTIKAGVDMEKAAKRLEELDNAGKLVCTVRNAYSEYNLISESDGVKWEDARTDTVKVLLGPTSEGYEMASPRIDNLPNTSLNGKYSGDFLMNIRSNMDSAVREYRELTVDKRLNESEESGVEAYIENNTFRHQKIQEEEGYGAVLRDIEEERNRIEEKFYENEEKFDKEFYDELKEATKAFNQMAFGLEINGQTGTLIVGEQKLPFAVAPDKKKGVYKLTITYPDKRSEELVMVMLPDGKLVIRGIPAVFDRL